MYHEYDSDPGPSLLYDQIQILDQNTIRCMGSGSLTPLFAIVLDKFCFFYGQNYMFL